MWGGPAGLGTRSCQQVSQQAGDTLAWGLCLSDHGGKNPCACYQIFTSSAFSLHHSFRSSTRPRLKLSFSVFKTVTRRLILAAGDTAPGSGARYMTSVELLKQDKVTPKRHF